MENPLDLAAPVWQAAQLACRMGSTDLRNASSPRRPGKRTSATVASLADIRFSALTAVHLQVQPERILYGTGPEVQCFRKPLCPIRSPACREAACTRPRAPWKRDTAPPTFRRPVSVRRAPA